jgi:lipopolysaccharide/colanic/teichoic acid biosynthesis glycosyltransferase
MTTKAKSFRELMATLFRRTEGRDKLGILPENEFKRILEYERALTDRHERRFSLLVFEPDGTGEHDLFFARLVDILGRRLRITDVVGWVSGERVGVLLPYSEKSGARVVADDVAAELASISFRTRCEVHTYPGDEDDRDGNSHGGDVDMTRGYPTPRVLIGGASEAKAGSNGGNGGREESIASAAVGSDGGLPPFRIYDGDSCRMLALFVPPPPAWKRALDIVIAGAGLLISAPVMLLTAAYIKAVSRGPVFFNQERVGYLGRKFMCWKFRTMHVRASTDVHQDHFANLMKSDTPMTKLDVKSDPRLIPLGRLIRASAVDELPQLFNVLHGDMSFVGPRPCIQYEYNNYQRWHKQRFDTLPGLTGLWQVSGKNRTSFSQMMRLDVSYARSASLRRDINIVWKTFPVLVAEVQNLMAQRRKQRHEAGA